jgi:hypothetical protein
MNLQVTDYIESIEKDWQKVIAKKVRSLVHEVDPQIEEKLKWGSAAYDHDGPVLWMFCAKDWVHISFPQGALLDAGHGLFEPTDNKGQRTIKIYQKDRFPKETLSKLISQAVQNNVEGKKISFNAPKPGSRIFDLPKDYEDLLRENGVLDAYQKRPYYQQSGWIRWMDSAKQESTKERRQRQMIDELKAGNVYMKMPW